MLALVDWLSFRCVGENEMNFFNSSKTFGGLVTGFLNFIMTLVGITFFAGLSNTLPMTLPLDFGGGIFSALIGVVLSFVIIFKLYQIMRNKYKIPIFARITLKNTVIVVMIFCVLAIFTNVVGNFITVAPSANQVRLNAMLGHVARTQLWIDLFTIVVIAPIIEETFLRGLMFSYLAKFHLTIQMLIPTLIFTLLHMPTNLFDFLNYFFMGASFMIVRVWTGTLQYSIAMHMSWNFMASLPLLATII